MCKNTAFLFLFLFPVPAGTPSNVKNPVALADFVGDLAANSGLELNILTEVSETQTASLSWHSLPATVM